VYNADTCSRPKSVVFPVDHCGERIIVLGLTGNEKGGNMAYREVLQLSNPKPLPFVFCHQAAAATYPGYRGG
jgi:hypothetical protein